MTRFRSANKKGSTRLWLLVSLVLAITLSAAATSNDSLPKAETIFADAARLRAEQREDSYLKAIAKYREAADLWRSARKFHDAAVALRHAGEILQLLGNTSQAKQAYEEALALSKITRSQLEEARIRNDLAYLHFIAGETSKARPNCLAALEIARRLHDRAIEAEALSNLGESFYNLGDLTKAQAYQQQALTIWRELGNQRGQALALIALGYYYANSGEPAKAISSYQEGLSLARGANDLGVEAQALIAIGHIKRKVAEKEEALASYQSAKLVAERLGDKTSQAIVAGGIGAVSLEMGDLRRALEYMEKATTLFEANSQKWGAAEGKLDLGRIHHALGNDQKALESLAEALTLFRSLSMPRLESVSLRAIGSVYRSRGENQNALEAFQKALRLIDIDKDQRQAAYTLNYIGSSYEDLKQLDRAERYYRKALTLAQRSADPESEALSLYNLAHLERDRGNLPAANRYIEEATAIIESVRTKVSSQDLRTSYFATVRDTYDLYIDILMLRYKQDPASGFDREAFAVSERARARSLLELLRDARTNVRDGVDSLPQPLNLKETQERILDNETTLLEFALGSTRSYVWVITRNSTASYELPARDEIEASAKRLYGLITDHQLVYGESLQARADREAKAKAAMPAEIAALSKQLLEPLAGKLNTKRLLVVPDGALQYIPFQILTDPDSSEPLLFNHEIVNQPSASTLALLLSEVGGRKSASGSVAVLADPVFEIDDSRLKQGATGTLDQQAEMLVVRQALRDVGITPDGLQIPRLFASGREADEIMAVAPSRTSLKAVGFAANRERVFSPELANYRILHIATHGIINSERPELSGVVLSLFDRQGNSQNGFLRLNDIYNLKLSADLVVLSACSSGLGKDVKGEGLIGLTRGFMYAGAAGVVASLWKVDDEATAELMKHFYEAMFKRGMSPAAALRDAQLALAKQPRWQSPYYWAGFVIQGQYDQKERFAEPSSGAIQIAVILLVSGSFLLASILFLRRRRNATRDE